MFLSASVFIGSIIVTILTLWILVLEQVRHERIVAARARGAIDRGIGYLVNRIRSAYTVVNTFFVQLGLRYVVHVALRKVLLSLSHVYERLLVYFEYNRRQAKVIKRDRKRWQQSATHLTEIADHKVETALSEQEKKQRKRKALDEQ